MTTGLCPSGEEHEWHSFSKLGEKFCIECGIPKKLHDREKEKSTMKGSSSHSKQDQENCIHIFYIKGEKLECRKCGKEKETENKLLYEGNSSPKNTETGPDIIEHTDHEVQEILE